MTVFYENEGAVFLRNKLDLETSYIKGNITSEVIFQNRVLSLIYTFGASLKIQSIIEAAKKSQISITSEKEAIR